ncbi:SpoIIE family protein phosphatase [Streptomyces thermoviolaceus]|nr:SpoIIE family protein phosphatase [Streptomyces thermoviolaceus]
MTPHSLRIATVTDAARARIAVARLAAASGVPALERTRLVTALSTRLRECLAEGGTCVVCCRVTTRDDEPALRVTVAPEHEAGTATGEPARETVEPAWETEVPCPEPVGCEGGGVPGEASVLAEALLAADEDTASVLRELAGHQELVAVQRERMHRSDQGVLSLRDQLDAARRDLREAAAASRAARAEAENARRRLTFVADASAVLTASLDQDEIVRQLPELLVPRYASKVDVWLFDQDERKGAAPHPAAAVVAARTGRPQYAADHPGNLPGVDDQPPSALMPTSPLLCLPLPTRRAPLGVLTLYPPEQRWSPDDAVMLVELARWASTAIDNARRFERNRDIAETLQRALLTDLPATTAGLSLAARYLPAIHGLNIGGDWYDAFRQPDGGLVTVVGDVTGHGLHAAVMMSQLRTALRAYAVDGASPGRVLTRLHLFLDDLQPDLYATAVIARFRPGDPTFTWATAGHPPPVLRTGDGRVEILDTEPGAMLGIPLEQEIDDHTLPLTDGTTLALYTDGLVERRARGIDQGIERLAAALGTFGPAELDADLDGSADRILVPLLSDSERDDDACLLLCHLHGEGSVTGSAGRAARAHLPCTVRT